MNIPTAEETSKFEAALESLKDQQIQRNMAFIRGAEIDKRYQKALENIQTNGKKLFILFHLDGCDGCTVLKYITRYNTDIVKELYDNYEVLIEEMTNVQTELTNKYSIYSFPTYMVVDKDEKMIKQGFGCYLQGQGVEYNFLQWLRI